MAKQYQWRTVCDLVSPSGMSNGFTPTTYASWQTAGAGTASANGIDYYYRDTNYTWTPAPDNNSSKANYVVNQSWVAEINDLNVLKITLNTEITSVYRDDVRHQSYEGQVLPFPDTPCRDIEVYDYTTADPTNPNDYGTYVAGFPDCEVAQAHTMYGQITFPTQVFYVQPSSGTTVIPIFIYNQTRGMPDRFDKVKIGVEFSNPLPAPVTYTLTYNANGGTGAPAADTAYTVDDTHTFTVTNSQPTWGSFIFLGWSNSPVSGSGTPADVDYVAGDTITLPRSNLSKTIYAVWEKDYRPGTSLDTGTSVWKSHNRTNGAAHVLSNTGNMTWTEMRTIGGAEGDKGNPPLILTAANANSWRNQKLLGKE